LTAALLVTTTAGAQQIQISKENKTIAVSTSDEVSALADTAVVTAGFSTFGRDQEETYAEATRISNAIFSALTGAGVPREAIVSTSQHLSPLEQNNDEDKARYSQGLRFSFSQSWQVTVPATQAAGVLHLAIGNGANNSGDIQWQLKNENALEAEAAKKALEHAREIAARMAQGLGAKLGGLMYASNQTPVRGPVRDLLVENGALNTSRASLAARMKNMTPLAIEPAQITKSTTVYAVFAID
jgi:uncharacterized protein YggE